MKKKFDKEELEFIQALESGTLKPIKNQEEMIAKLQRAASNHLKKDARASIRLSKADLTGIKIAADREGIPYQTLISSIIHKYLNGTLKPVPPV
jgi:predicted DNA binding CopG/RHH family protein